MTIHLKDDEIFLTTKEVSQITKFKEDTLAKHRQKKTGIPFIILESGSVRYSKTDVINYMTKNKKTLDN